VKLNGIPHSDRGGKIVFTIIVESRTLTKSSGWELTILELKKQERKKLDVKSLTSVTLITNSLELDQNDPIVRRLDVKRHTLTKLAPKSTD
jgi:hypothetical protein